MSDTGRQHEDGHSHGGAGPLAEEAARLVAAVQTWAQRTMPAPPSGHPGPECQWCPLCQLASALRGEHPELTARVADAGVAVLSAVRTLAETVADSAAEQRGAGAARDDEPGAGPAEPAAHPRVEHIDLTGDG